MLTFSEFGISEIVESEWGKVIKCNCSDIWSWKSNFYYDLFDQWKFIENRIWKI